jgi:hypothetical protein
VDGNRDRRRPCPRGRENYSRLDIEVVVVLHRQVRHPAVTDGRCRAADHDRGLAVRRLELLARFELISSGIRFRPLTVTESIFFVIQLSSGQIPIVRSRWT